MKKTLILTSEDVRALPACERVGLVYPWFGPDAARLVKTVVSAEAAGVRQVWSTQGPVQDTLTAFAAAAVHTRDIRLGTAIIPTYSRHPLTMVAQALALDDLAPGRLRLGIGSSHRPIIEGTYGIKMVKPLEYLREYVQVVRAALWKGKVDHKGTFFTVNATLPRIAQIPLLTSALRENAFKQAGEMADGALCWNCPVSVLVENRSASFASVGTDTWPPGSTPDCACDDGCERRSSCSPFGHASPNPDYRLRESSFLCFHVCGRWLSCWSKWCPL